MAIDYQAAIGKLTSAGISLDTDFHALTSSQVLIVLDVAKAAGYRVPKNASGSPARMFFAALQRKGGKP